MRPSLIAVGLQLIMLAFKMVDNVIERRKRHERRKASIGILGYRLFIGDMYSLFDNVQRKSKGQGNTCDNHHTHLGCLS